MDVEKFRNILKDRQTELMGSLTQSEEEARGTPSAEVEDAIDRANSDEPNYLELEMGNR